MTYRNKTKVFENNFWKKNEIVFTIFGFLRFSVKETFSRVLGVTSWLLFDPVEQMSFLNH